MAILRVGGQSISSLTETSREAQLCNVFYEVCRDQVLRAFPWNFARKRADLGLLTATAPTNWGYAYALPPDCINILSVVQEGVRIPRTNQRTPWEYGVLDGSKALFCDYDAVELEYVGLPDVSFFDPQFVNCLAWLLAVELAGPLLGKPELAVTAKQAYFGALSEARAGNLNEQCDQDPESEFLTVRGINSTGFFQ